MATRPMTEADWVLADKKDASATRIRYTHRREAAREIYTEKLQLEAEYQEMQKLLEGEAVEELPPVAEALNVVESSDG